VRVAAALALAVVLVACSRPEPTELDRAEDAMAAADAGTVTVELADAFSIVATFEGEEFELTLNDHVTREQFVVTDDDVDLEGDGGFADLGVASWVEDPTDGPVITGRADAADLLADIVRLASYVSEEVHELDDDDAEALAQRVRTNRIEVVLEDGVPASIDATLGFLGYQPEIVDALGPYAAETLEWHVTFSDLPAQQR
jgi:hypothetical protein